MDHIGEAPGWSVAKSDLSQHTWPRHLRCNKDEIMSWVPKEKQLWQKILPHGKLPRFSRALGYFSQTVLKDCPKFTRNFVSSTQPKVSNMLWVSLIYITILSKFQDPSCLPLKDELRNQLKFHSSATTLCIHYYAFKTNSFFLIL